jgi:ribosomal protein S18 acetylase RimI-like enzyme
MEVRALTEVDGANYRDLRLRALREEPEAFGASYEERVGRPLEETAARLRQTSEPPDHFTLGAFAPDDRLIGSVSFTRQTPSKERHRGTITAMYVAPEARGRGTGKQLLRAAIARAQALEGMEQITLGVVSTNAAARALYRALGFVVFGHEPRALKVGERYLDEELMVLWLTPQLSH